MFSALQLAELANQEFEDCARTEHFSGEWDSVLIERMISHLSHGWPILFPYDAAKNHEPCVQNGASAHWGIMKGFIVASSSSDAAEQNSGSLNLSPNSEVHFLYSEVSNTKPSSVGLDVPNPSRLWLVCQQAKSKHQFIWTFNSIMESNHNLYFYDADKLRADDISTSPDLRQLRRSMLFISPIA